ncbi:MAG: hypothetical protein JWO79_2733 [Actinomycetia bacterium]|jgi:hypothetical protein|nr:hypothetical protein [Actinomycetes bacterium]MDQ1652291.1 hypothetical protein [Cryptosporangiaceae bacterium]
MADTAELRAEIETVEGEIRVQEDNVEQLRRDMGSDGPTDGAEQAQILTTVEEQTALLENLRNRREVLQKRLQDS